MVPGPARYLVGGNFEPYVAPLVCADEELIRQRMHRVPADNWERLLDAYRVRKRCFGSVAPRVGFPFDSWTPAAPRDAAFFALDEHPAFA